MSELDTPGGQGGGMDTAAHRTAFLETLASLASAGEFRPAAAAFELGRILGATEAVYVEFSAAGSHLEVSRVEAKGLPCSEGLTDVFEEVVLVASGFDPGAFDRPLPLSHVLGPEATEGVPEAHALTGPADAGWHPELKEALLPILERLEDLRLEGRASTAILVSEAETPRASLFFFTPKALESSLLRALEEVLPAYRAWILAGLRLTHYEGDARLLDAWLDAIPIAAWVTDAAGMLERANERAKEAMRENPDLEAEVRQAVANRFDVAQGPFSVRPLEGEGLEGLFCVTRIDIERDAATRAKQAAARYALTRRETQVLTELLRGRSNKEIARRIGCSTRTVEDHVARLLKKLGVTSRAAAIAAVWSAVA